MTQDELVDLLQAHEWRDVEFKEAQPVECELATAFNEESIRWYRGVYEAKPGNRSYAGLSGVDFLGQMGLLAGHGENRVPTRAAVLRLRSTCERRHSRPSQRLLPLESAAPRQAPRGWSLRQ